MTDPSEGTASETSQETTLATATAKDRIRQIGVCLSALIAIVGALIGSGALGGESMPMAAGGAFAADATPIAPGGPAFSIWSVIYAGLVAYAVWQCLPKQAAAVRHRRVGWWIAASMLLNAAWLLAVQAGLLWVTVLIIVLLLAVLVVAFVKLRTSSGSGLIDVVATDGTIGLYLGWIVVATAANVAAVLAAEGLGAAVDVPEAWAVVVLSVAGLVGIALAVWDRGRFAPTVALCWGLVWVAIARLTGDLVMVPAAVAALAAAAAVLAVTIAVRLGPRGSAAGSRRTRRAG